MEERIILGKKLEKIREKKGILRHFIHKKYGLKYDLINSIEKGSSNYTINSLLIYAEAINVNLLKLVKNNEIGKK